MNTTIHIEKVDEALLDKQRRVLAEYLMSEPILDPHEKSAFDGILNMLDGWADQPKVIEDEDHKEQEAYLGCNGSRCPKCNSKQLQSDGTLQSDGGIVWQNVDCVCGAYWTDQYSLTGFNNFHEEDADAEPDVENDEFKCESCDKISDIENSIKVGDELHCEDCVETQRRDEKKGLYPEKEDTTN